MRVFTRHCSKFLILLALPGLLVLSITQSAVADCKVQQLEIHVNRVRGLPFIDGAINGSPANILLDTGATASYISRTTANRLRLKTQSSSMRFEDDSGVESSARKAMVDIRVDKVERKNVRLYVSTVGSDDVDLVLGADFFSQLTTEFDLGHGAIRLLSANGCRVPQLVSWSKTYSLVELFGFDNNRPLIESGDVVINDNPVRAAFATGSKFSYMTRRAADRLGVVLTDDKRIDTVLSGAQNRREIWIERFQKMSIGDERYENAKLRVKESFSPRSVPPDVIIGEDFFESHRILVEPRERQALFTYNGGPVFQVALADEPSPNARPSMGAHLTELNQLVASRNWPTLERRAREVGNMLRTVVTADSTDLATADAFLGLAIRHQGRYREAEPLIRRTMATREKVLGPEHPDTVTSVNELAVDLDDQGHYAEAQALLRHALAIRERTLGSENRQTAVSVNNLAFNLMHQGRYAEAETSFRRALAIREKVLGAGHPDTAASLCSLGRDLRMESRYAEAEQLYRRALATQEKVLGSEHPDTIMSVNDLAVSLDYQGRRAEAEPLFRRVLAIREKALGSEDPRIALSVHNLAWNLDNQRRYAEAEPLFRRALAIRGKVLGSEHPDTALTLLTLAVNLEEQERYMEAEPFLRRSLAGRGKVLGPAHPDTVASVNSLAWNLQYQHRYAEAVPLFRRSCTGYTSRAELRDQNAQTDWFSRRRLTNCSHGLALSLWGWSRSGGGTTSSDRPQALLREAFTVSQHAMFSAAGDAISHAAAHGAAAAAGVGREAQEYEEAVASRDAIDLELAKSLGESPSNQTEVLERYNRNRESLQRDIQRLEAELQSKSPLYWDLRSPQSIEVAALQGSAAPDGSLLHDNEVLVWLLPTSNRYKGLVFAVTKQHVAWAQVAYTGTEIRDRVQELRAEIDPRAYKSWGFSPQKSPSTNADLNQPGFDRKLSFELYHALLGDAAIQDVIRDKSVLLWVPSGPLTSLPPALLVTEPPSPGTERTTDSETLRRTPWLLRSKAIAVLPSVSSLRTLRQLQPKLRSPTPDVLLAFADPDFRGGEHPNAPVAAATRGVSEYYRDGAAIGEALRGLPPLPGTRIEARALRHALGASIPSTLFGKEASKGELFERNTDGRLGRVNVLMFATHGLVAGDLSDLAEPALVLAAGQKPEDELLRASEASTLHINADWVLLSACNTASPDAPEAQGLSGLSRAFFYAGARALLVTHWRVRDDIAPLVIPATILAERNDPTLSHAEALRRATLAVLDDPKIDAADPAAWAPFTLVGEATR